MSSLRRPLNPDAVAKADDEFYANHPEFIVDGKRVPLSATDPDQKDLRKEWIASYRKFNNEPENPKTDPGKKPADPVDPCPPKNDPAPPPAEDKPRIVWVDFLDGADDVLGGGIQWVNLPRDAKWVDAANGVTNIDRMSHKPRIKVGFDRPGGHAFRVKYVPDASNLAYTGTEEGRTNHFLYQKAKNAYTTDGDGTKILPIDDFFVTTAGTHKYTLEAEDDFGNKVTSQQIEVSRLVYYVEVKMTGLASVASTLSVLEAEYANHNLKLVGLPSVNMPHLNNINDTIPAEVTTFQNNTRTAYNTSQAVNKEPYAIAIAYTDHLAIKNPGQSVIQPAVEVGPGKPAVNLPIVVGGNEDTTVKARALWKNLVPGEGWFVSAKYLPDGGTPADEVDIPEAKCTPSPAGADNCKAVDIDVTGLPAGKGTITLTVDTVDIMAGGLSFGTGNMVCVCTRAWWRNKSTADQNAILVHEVGHKIGMVVDGTGILPDKTATHYVGKGHFGNHCHHPLPVQPMYNAAADVATADCTMFGATTGYASFCENCAPAVKKVDLCTGWPRL